MDQQYDHPEEMLVEESNDMDYTTHPEEAQVVPEDQVMVPLPAEFQDLPEHEIGN